MWNIFRHHSFTDVMSSCGRLDNV